MLELAGVGWNTRGTGHAFLRYPILGFGGNGMFTGMLGSSLQMLSKDRTLRGN